MGHLIGMARLAQQNIENGKIGVPLDQSGDRTEAPERRPIGLPDLRSDPGTVIVYQNVDVFGDVMPGYMDLTNRRSWERLKVGDRVQFKI
jgi:hypothetical protein